MSELHRITLNAEVCGGRPCLRGTRVRVSDIFDMLAAGMSHDEILADHLYLEAGDITAALEFASLQANHLILQAA